MTPKQLENHIASRIQKLIENDTGGIVGELEDLFLLMGTARAQRVARLLDSKSGQIAFISEYFGTRAYGASHERALKMATSSRHKVRKALGYLYKESNAHVPRGRM